MFDFLLEVQHNFLVYGGSYMNKERAINDYFADCISRKRLNEKTIKAYKIDLKHFFDYMDEELEDSEKITEYIYRLNNQYEKAKTIKRKIASIKAFYSYLEYEGVIETSPFRKIRTKIKEPFVLPKTISSDVIQKIIFYQYESINNSESDYQLKKHVRNTAIIELLLATGIRISELCHIEQANINLNTGTLKINGKGSKERNLYININPVIEILKRYIVLYEEELKNNKYFFMNKIGERLSEQSVRYFLNTLEIKLDLPIKLTPHMFRHTFATMLLEDDVDIRYIQKILGHSSISVTQIYTYVTSAKQKEIMLEHNPRKHFE